MGQNNDDKGIDLSGALDNSSSRVKFEGDERVTSSYNPGTPKVIQWVIKYSSGYIKDEKQASYAIQL